MHISVVTVESCLNNTFLGALLRSIFVWEGFVNNIKEKKKIRVVMAKVSLDGHDRGIKVISSMLRDSGMEVIYMGPFQTPENVVMTAIDEDADVIGLSFLSGEHLSHTPKIIKLLKEKKIDDMMVIVGGVFPRDDIPRMKDMGIDEVFLSGTSMHGVVEYIKVNVK